MILEDYISINARLFPDKLAVTDGAVRYSYAELHQHVLEKKTLFEKYRGKAYLFRASQDVEFVVTYFALHLAGCVAVPLAQDFPEQAFIKLSKQLENASFDSCVADILFTTGTTGLSKGVLISHDAIIADAENLVEAQRFSSDLTFVICGPLNHIGSLSKLFPSIKVGASIHILEGMKDTNAFFSAIVNAEHKVASFMVPATIKMVLSLDKERLHSVANKIDFIETGAAAMAESDMKHLVSILPHSRLYNTYASTETGIIATHDFNSVDCVAGCLGHSMKNSSIEINKEGKVVCTGRTIMLGYWNDKQLTDSILYDNAIHTNDLGYLDAQGRLRLTGRDDDTINIGGYKVSPVEIENQVMAIDGVRDCICICASHRILGNVLKLLILPENDNRPSFKDVASVLKEKMESYKIPQLYEYVERIERTYNGKLNRKAYRH